MPIRPATPADLPAITRLLTSCGLAPDGVEGCLADCLVAEEGRQVVGVAGLERSGGPVALLRSVAVLPDHRGQGIARALCRALHAQATRTGLDGLYLLTTSAPDFFSGLGYKRRARDEAPVFIQATAQFRDLCPASAVLMRLDLTMAPDEETP